MIHMDASLSLFGLTVYPYGLYAAAGTLLLLCAMGVIGYQSRLPAGTVRVFGLIGIPLGVLCARAAFCALNAATFTETFENPWLMLRFFDGGLSMTGLLCGLTLAALIAARVMKARFGSVLDTLCVPLGLLTAALCAGMRFTELGIGKVAEQSALTAAMPWLFLSERMGVNIEYRMAAYRYEAAAGVLLFIVMLILFLCARKRKRSRPGDLALVFFSLYGATQTLLESLRDDGHMMITFLRVAQLCAALMTLVATGVFSKRYRYLQGGGGKRIAVTWLCQLMCVAGLIFLEFSLDGRITWGNPTMGRDYAIMTALCALMAAMPCSLYHTLSSRLYRNERFSVRTVAGS